MTEDEHIHLVEVGNEYWNEFSQLIAAKLQKVPPHLRDEFLAMMQDKSSVYGSCYDKYMPKKSRRKGGS